MNIIKTYVLSKSRVRKCMESGERELYEAEAKAE